MEESQTLRIAIHPSGSLFEKSIRLLSQCQSRSPLNHGGKEHFEYEKDLEILFIPQRDIPNFVNDGTIDAGIIGEEILAENGYNSAKLDIELGIDNCKLSIISPNGSKINQISDLEGKRIGTSYPNILRQQIQLHLVNALVIELSPDTVKTSISLGITDAIFDKSLEDWAIPASGLRQISFSQKIFDSVIIFSKGLTLQKQTKLEALKFKLQSIITAQITKYVVFNAPKHALDAIVQLVPSMESPTVLNLHRPDWVAVHTVIEENTFWSQIDQIKKLGAEGILVIPLEKILA